MKKIISFFLISLFAGALLHQAKRKTQELPQGFSNLTDYVIGVEGTSPFFMLLLKILGMKDDDIVKAFLAFQAAFLAIGLGVAGAWWWDTLFPKLPDTEEAPK